VASLIFWRNTVLGRRDMLPGLWKSLFGLLTNDEYREQVKDIATTISHNTNDIDNYQLPDKEKKEARVIRDQKWRKK
jgi:hypothetical protein